MSKVSARKALLISLLIGVGSVAGGLFPTSTFAAELTTVTAQVLPQGSNGGCPQLIATGFTPYVYNNALDSFEFTIPDVSYVAIIGTAGDTVIPFNQMTRSLNAQGMLRIHADMASTPIRETLPIKVTMLSSKGPGQPVCLSVVSTSIASNPSTAGTGTTPTPIYKPVTSKPTTPVTSTKPPKVTGTSSSTATTSAPVVGSTNNVLANTCSSSGGATRLWFVLLALYALVTGIATIGQPQTNEAWKKEWISAIVVVPFVLLFGVWYFLESCRTGGWAPAIAILIALAGLAATFWGEKRGTTMVIPLPAAAKKPETPKPVVVTSAPAAKK